ncbi:LacI family DNA-binding transcriptional regulator [Roseateles sp. BYS78W]|uniref:LacI family DNA-binding transcriptional regulator n=1 Tax=Pelomonas candidula TaxID=3299025 RepID=A0ABW7HCL5_9BURK
MRQRRGGKVSTIADVAAFAGVSAMTVSRVVNDEPNVRPGTREKVKAAIEALHYSPGPPPRRVAPPAAGLTRIGVLYGDPSVGYLNDFLLGLLKKATLRQVQLLVERCEGPEDEPRLLANMLRGGVDGVILPPPFCDSPQMLRMLAQAGTPTVAVSSAQPSEQVCAVGIDDYQAAYEMTRHLLSLGHQRLGFIVGDKHQNCSARRLAGFRAAMQDACVDIAEDEAVAQGKFSYRSGLDAAEFLLSQVHGRRPTAIFASNDDMAAATVAIAHRKGIEVPRDLTVVGFDDAPLATTIWPELTTVRQPITAMAGAAVDLLVRHIRARQAGDALPCEHKLMGFELVRRQSDAAPRPRPIPVA